MKQVVTSSNMAFDESKNKYLQLCLILYDLSGLRVSSKLFLRILSLYILYPLILVFMIMVIYNLRYKYNVYEITEVLTTICIFISTSALLKK